MKIIVGLGNPGLKYERTRHNLGFIVLDHFLKNFEPQGEGDWEESKKFKSDFTQISWQPKKGVFEKVILLKPRTYMNNSGMAVKAAKDFYKVQNSDIWIIHDDVDLVLGNMKIRLGGASAGHRGVESIIDALGTDNFWRFRLGIGRPKQNNKEGSKAIFFRGVDEYVLGNMTGQDWGKAKTLVKKAVKALETALEKDLSVAMNRFNSK